MKKAVFFLTVLASLCLFSCSSPENDGKSIANKLNNCNESYMEEMQKMESNFIAGFNGAAFQTRKEAKQAYLDVAEEVYTKYRDALAKVYEQEAEMAKKYASDYKKKAKYDGALHSGIDQDLESKVVELTVATKIPESVMAKVRTVISPKPDYLQIQEDLVGHSLSEGVDDGYYSSDWKWIIREGEISGFTIENVLTDNPQEYLIIAKMRLTSEEGKAFDVKVKIRYVLPQNDDWTIDFTQSLGMHIVKTGAYESCITKEKGSFGYFYVMNNCDRHLEVGGKEFNVYGGWSEKRSFVVSPHDSYGMICDDFKIDYVEVP